MKLRLAVIVGPTASGKTWLGVRVAHRLGSEIVSADSRQVYRGLDIGTGKDLAEYSRVDPPVPYHLTDVADVRDVYSLFHYQRDCYATLRELAGRPPFAGGECPLLLVGGTGLYVEAVLRQYRFAQVPEDPELRQRLGQESREALDERLKREDPKRWERTDRSTRRRLVRALEIVEWSREHPVEETPPLGLDLVFQVFCVTIQREGLQERIRERLIRRIEEGMVDEARRLLDEGVRRERLDELGLEYRELAAHLAGEKSLEQMIDDLARAIRRFAKRQETWFRGMERRGIPVTVVGPDDVDRIVEGGSAE